MDDTMKGFIAATIGVIAGYFARLLQTPQERRDTLGRLAKELDITTDQLVEAFRDMRVTKRRTELLIGYLIQTLEHMARHKLKPLALPAELESDPDLSKYFKAKKARKK